MEDFEKAIKVNLIRQQLGVETGIEKSFEDEIEKGGAGSRGGKIIGHTKSGKPIYAQQNARHEHSYSSKDHEDAAYAHMEHNKKTGGTFNDHHVNEFDRHMESSQHKKVYEDMEKEGILKKSLVDELEKGGEGSRGGRIIGHTKSGKPVYANAHASQYDDFDNEDHKDAAELHGKVMKHAMSLGSIETRDAHKYKMRSHQRVFDPSMAKAEEDELEKGGEGSRGGKVIGHTKSGKPIYDTFEHEGHKNYNAADHKDAADKHHELSRESDAHKLHFTTQKHRNERQKHFNEHTDKLNTLTKKQSEENEKISHPKGDHPIHAKLDKFLSQFPDNAKSWGQATDEIRDLARSAKEHINEYDLDVPADDAKAHKPLDFQKLSTPAEWNTKGKKYIKDAVAKMSDTAKNAFMKEHSEWFGKGVVDELEKARSGVYKNTVDNRKQGRAGERYGAAVHGGQTQDLEGSRDKNPKEAVVKLANGKKVTLHGNIFQSKSVPIHDHLTIQRALNMMGYSKEDIGQFKFVDKAISDTLTKAVKEGIITEEVLEKARAGIYAPTAQNKKKGVVGQKYGSKKQDETPAGNKPKTGDKEQMEDSSVNLEEHAKTASEAALTAAIKQSPDPEVRQAAHNELKRRQTEEKSGGEVFGKPVEDKGEQLKKEYHEGMKKDAKETKQLKEDKGVSDSKKSEKKDLSKLSLEELSNMRTDKVLKDNPDLAKLSIDELMDKLSEKVKKEDIGKGEKKESEKKETSKLDDVLSTFSDNAKSWKEATDEIRDLAREAKEYYNEYDLDVTHDDEKAHKPLDFKKLTTPAEWNIQGKKYIKDTVAKMSDATKKKFMEHLSGSNKIKKSIQGIQYF
jgi:hypothetical protein